MEAGTLAELIVIWLQAFGALWILNNLVDEGMDLLHFVEVSQFSSQQELQDPSYLRAWAELGVCEGYPSNHLRLGLRLDVHH